jgi:hypothetical protein
MLPSMHIMFPVRLAVRDADASRALAILDAPYQDDDDELDFSGDDFPNGLR